MIARQTIAYLVLIAALSFLCSCSNLKYIPAGDALYTGAKINLKAPGLKAKRKKALREELASLARPKPNSKILGMRIRLYAWNIAGTPKKEKSPRGLLKNKIGEPPVLLSDVNVQRNMQVLQSDLENLGFFRDSVSGDTLVKKKLASAVYTIDAGPRYRYRTVAYATDSSEIGKAIAAAAPHSLLKPKKRFSLAGIKNERNRVDSSVKEKGFYFFNPDLLLAKADTAVGNHSVDLTMRLKPAIPAPSLQPYKINNVYVFAGYSLNNPGDTSVDGTTAYEGLHIRDTAGLYRPILFQQSILFQPNTIYQQSVHSRSLNRLITLGLFKFVKNRFEIVSGIDSPKLNVYYYLTPMPKKSLNFELTGTTKSDNLTGSQATIGWKNRNAFRAGELLSVNLTGGFEVQYGGALKGFNTYRGSLETKLAIPRFIVPFFSFNTGSGFVPKTNILAAYDVLDKEQLFTLYSLRTSFGYSWKESNYKEHDLNPISIEFVHPFSVTPLYEDSAMKYPTLQQAILPEFILGSTYSFTYNPMQGQNLRSGWYFNGNMDISGNIAGLLSGAGHDGKKSTIFGYDFAQYIRADIDLRRYVKFSKTGVWANRLLAGVGFPYGNSTVLPYVKQFFVGGSNSIRAFRSMALGPGTVAPPDLGTASFFPNQTGDIKLEANTELRAKLFSIVNGALFVDAGNVWLKNKDTTAGRAGAEFTSRFLQQLGVGAGAGLRFDISFLVLRLDLAIPLRIPYLPAGQEWVINKINFSDP
ncbi:MAG TPA: BamA/TamA family outer membrane protein, partial [Chitinophagaceae bacterium]